MKLSWDTEGIRLTVFPTIPVTEKQQWWEELIGEPPEEELKTPKSGLIQQSGPFKEGNLTLSIQPGRIDWTWSPNFPSQSAKSFPNVGKFSESSKIFHELLSNWLLSSPESSRIAYGPILLHSVEDRTGGYKLLAQLLKLDFNLDNAREFLLQINRPRRSKTGLGGEVNRLSTWSVTNLKTLNLLPGLAMPPSQVDNIYACRVQLDINNVPTSTPISTAELVAFFNECRELAEEIADNGDCE